jgi:hypothetical protein
VLKCIARRCTVLGFDRADNLTAATASVVVIGGTEEEYINGLQAVRVVFEPVVDTDVARSVRRPS